MRQLTVGTSARVSVPATSANLGPGFDSIGMAVDLRDEVRVDVTESGVTVTIDGEGADDLPRDESHLVVATLKAGLAAAGVEAPGLKVHCTNRIPQSRGLGSSAAAAVAGFAAAQVLATGELDLDALINASSEVEGHPDNAAAAVLGGAVVSWTAADGASFGAVHVGVHPDIRATVFIPSTHALTKEIRQVLPSDVSHVDARFNVARAALLPLALSEHPELLPEATDDRLHQPYRATALPQAHTWITRLREAGYAGYLSGAGPTVMVLSTIAVDSALVEAATDEGYRVAELAIGAGVRVEAQG